MRIVREPRTRSGLGLTVVDMRIMRKSKENIRVRVNRRRCEDYEGLKDKIRVRVSRRRYEDYEESKDKIRVRVKSRRDED
jgi:hypothetical protein